MVISLSLKFNVEISDVMVTNRWVSDILYIFGNLVSVVRHISRIWLVLWVDLVGWVIICDRLNVRQVSISGPEVWSENEKVSQIIALLNSCSVVLSFPDICCTKKYPYLCCFKYSQEDMRNRWYATLWPRRRVSAPLCSYIFGDYSNRLHTRS